MATDHARPQISEVVEFYEEEDGSITARDLETGRARGGDTREEALLHLAEVLILEAGGGEPVTEEDLREWGLDPNEIPDEPKPLPDFMQ